MVKIVVTCQQCGKKFEAYPSQIKQGKKYCGKKCADLAKIGKYWTKKVRINHKIGRMFPSYKDPIKKICPYCGKEFITYRHHPRKYCSSLCAHKAQIGKRNHKITKTCIVCDKKFDVFPYRKNAKYCSYRCNALGNNIGQHNKVTKIKRICQYCGKEFEIYPSAFKHNEGKYCSRKCHYKDITGNNNPNYGKKRSPEIVKKMRLKRLKEISEKKFDGDQVIPSYNLNACKFFEKFDQSNGTIGMYATNGGEYHIKELGYFPDYFNPNLRLIMEWDEENHYKNDQLKKKDIRRQKEIKNLFPDYDFVRIREKDLIGV